MTGALCRSFRDLGAQTWRRLESAARTGLAWSEETNTETVLLELRERHPSAIKILSFTKTREAKNGSDWEWWIGGKGAWFGMRVQAKRLKKTHPQFWRLKEYKAKNAASPQIDTLIQAAKRDGLTPAYCLYVFDGLRRAVGAGPLAHYPEGCLVGHAAAIKHLDSNDLGSLAPVLLPWHLLVCDCVKGAAGSTIAGCAQGTLQRSWAAARSDDRIDPMLTLLEPVADLPDYMKLLGVGAVDEERVVAQIMVSAKAEVRGIRGLVLIDGGEVSS